MVWVGDPGVRCGGCRTHTAELGRDAFPFPHEFISAKVPGETFLCVKEAGREFALHAVQFQGEAIYEAGTGLVLSQAGD